MARVVDKADKEHLLNLRLQIMKEIDPFFFFFSELQLHHLYHNRKIMENYSEKNEE